MKMKGFLPLTGQEQPDSPAQSASGAGNAQDKADGTLPTPKPAQGQGNLGKRRRQDGNRKTSVHQDVGKDWLEKNPVSR